MFLEHRRSPTALGKYVRWTTISVGRTLVTKKAWTCNCDTSLEAITFVAACETKRCFHRWVKQKHSSSSCERNRVMHESVSSSSM